MPRQQHAQLCRAAGPFLARWRGAAQFSPSNQACEWFWPTKAQFRLDKQSRDADICHRCGPHPGTHVIAMAQRPASARFQKQPRASTAFLPMLFLERRSDHHSERERERERGGGGGGGDDGDDEGLARGGGGAVAARVRLRQRGGRPAGEAAPVRSDGDAEPLLLLPPRQPGPPGSLPIHTRPLFRGVLVLCSSPIRLVLGCAELVWTYFGLILSAIQLWPAPRTRICDMHESWRKCLPVSN
jgi:hypothetical protein